MFTDRPNRPETEIIRRVHTRMKELGLKPKEVAERINDSELYGEYTYGSFRNLLTQNFEDDSKPRDTLNVQLLYALSEILECDVFMLANHRELESIRVKPYRKRQWPESMLAELAENSPRTSVPSPELTAKRIWAYARLHGHDTIPEFGRVLRATGKADVSDKTLKRVFRGDPDPDTRKRLITFEFCEKVARAFRGPRQREEFDVQWLLKCREGLCPHCHPILIEVR